MKLEYSFCITYQNNMDEKISLTKSEGDEKEIYIKVARNIANLAYKNHPELKNKFIDITVKSR